MILLVHHADEYAHAAAHRLANVSWRQGDVLPLPFAGYWLAKEIYAYSQTPLYRATALRMGFATACTSSMSGLNLPRDKAWHFAPITRF